MAKKTVEYYMSLPYPIVLIPDSDDDTWYAKIPGLTGCMADGRAPAEALDALDAVKALWFEVSLERGHTIPEPPGTFEIEFRRYSDIQGA